uniref:Ribosomal protein L13A n=1 Tax=Lotharella vacuolata TaxID=74820 RepID=A0A0H5BL40_9EUKA|nr:ribosomal protein L13A [Lotharella vacuolata]
MKCIVVNANNSIYGRIITKIIELVKKGFFVKVLNCQNLILSGRKEHSIKKFISKFNKKTHTNPNKGPFKFSSPANIFLKSIRGMISYKKKAFMNNFKKIQCFNGEPSRFRFQKNFVFRNVHKSIRLKNSSKWIYLKEISKKLGWDSEISFITDYKKKNILSLNLKNNFKVLSAFKNDLNKLQ